MSKLAFKKAHKNMAANGIKMREMKSNEKSGIENNEGSKKKFEITVYRLGICQDTLRHGLM